jgi:hypothetical protein
MTDVQLSKLEFAMTVVIVLGTGMVAAAVTIEAVTGKPARIAIEDWVYDRLPR